MYGNGCEDGKEEKRCKGAMKNVLKINIF